MGGGTDWGAQPIEDGGGACEAAVFQSAVSREAAPPPGRPLRCAVPHHRPAVACRSLPCRAVPRVQVTVYVYQLVGGEVKVERIDYTKGG